jgi:hypothetical protein
MLPVLDFKLTLPGELHQVSVPLLLFWFPTMGRGPDPEVQDFDAAPDAILSN